MKSLLLIIGVIVLIFGGAFLMINNSGQNQEALSTTSNDAKSFDTSTTENEIAPINSETASGAGENTEIASVGTYIKYDAEKIAQSSADHIFLFFHAIWCPSCRALDADIVKNSSTIPSGVEIYKTDYDTAIALKKQYGITMQHSLIEIAKDGTAKSSITHPATLADVLKTI